MGQRFLYAILVHASRDQKEGRNSVNNDHVSKSRLLELIQYFWGPFVAIVIVIVVFLVTRSEINTEIQKGTYQSLQDSTMQQRVTVSRYIDLLAARTALIAEYDSDTGPNTLVESLRTELHESVNSMEIGFANESGDLLYSDQAIRRVADQDWFSRSLVGETLVSLASQNLLDEQVDVLVSTPVHTSSGVNGVLFVTIDGREIAKIIQTLTYDADAMSVICDSKGVVLFCEAKLEDKLLGKSVFDFAEQISMQTKPGTFGLAAALKKGLTTGFSYQYNDRKYYAVATSVGVSDWRVITFVASEKADYIQRRVNMFQTIMLFVMLMVGVSLAIQSYLHERATVQKLERDKDLLQQSAKRYQLITQLSKEVLFSVQLNTGEISFNDSFDDMFGFPPPLCTIDDLDNCMHLFVEADRHLFTSMINKLRAGAAAAHEELRMVNSRGLIRWKRIEVFSVFDKDDHVSQLVGKIADIQRQKQSMQRLIRQADSEPLTGLLNRGAMERNVKGFLEGEGVYGKHALLMLDFDNFKAVNDTLGHAEGDDLLVSFASGIKRIFRSGDYASRVGGDEYMVFVKNIFDDGVALEKAELLREEMINLSRKIGIPVSISVGIAIYNRDGETFERLYKAADEALYHVKNNGKNSISFFSIPADRGTEIVPLRQESEDLDDIDENE